MPQLSEHQSRLCVVRVCLLCLGPVACRLVRCLRVRHDLLALRTDFGAGIGAVLLQLQEPRVYLLLLKEYFPYFFCCYVPLIYI